MPSPRSVSYATASSVGDAPSGGQPLDFQEILRTTQSHIRAYIAGLGVPRHDVDDVAQDVYVEFYKALDRMPAEASPTQWLKGIARNLSMNYFRRTSRRGRLHREALAELLMQAEADSAETKDRDPTDAAERLRECFEKLPPTSRKLVKMRYEQELPSQSIADRMNSTAEAVRVALFRVRAALRDCITRATAPATT